MPGGDWFLAAMIALQGGGALKYLMDGDIRQFILWFAAAVSNSAYLSLSRK